MKILLVSEAANAAALAEFEQRRTHPNAPDTLRSPTHQEHHQ